MRLTNLLGRVKGRSFNGRTAWARSFRYRNSRTKMANTPQAKKRIRRNARRTEVNGARVSRIRTFIKKVESAI